MHYKKAVFVRVLFTYVWFLLIEKQVLSSVCVLHVYLVVDAKLKQFYITIPKHRYLCLLYHFTLNIVFFLMPHGRHRLIELFLSSLIQQTDRTKLGILFQICSLLLADMLLLYARHHRKVMRCASWYIIRLHKYH